MGIKHLTRAGLRKLSRSDSVRSLPHWLAAACVGLMAVLYAEGFHLIEEFSATLFKRWPFWCAALAPLLFFLGWWVIYKFAPGARGSGIPQVMASINSRLPPSDPRLDQALGMRVGIVKVASSTLCLLGGGAIGREGPTIHLAAVVFHSIGKRFRKLLEPFNYQHWLITAGAAGLAAAFNTPLGGIVFALEELATFHFIQFRTVLFSSVIISGMMAQWIIGPYLYFGYPKIGPVPPASLVYALLLGVGGGALGGLFSKSLLLGNRRIGGWSLRRRVVFICAAGIAVTLLAIAFGAPIRGSGTELTRNLLFSQDKDISWSLLAGRFTSTVLSYLSGCAGGIFAPSLTLGAIVGAKIDALIHSGNPNLLILLGMTSFLSAVTRAPFTSLIVVLEMTDRHSAIFPMMMSSVLASAVAGWVEARSFYHQQMEGFLIDLKGGAV